MTNPFDTPDTAYRVLVNEQQQHSLWPRDLPAPGGWSPVFGPDTRDACVAYVDSNWGDMRPASIRTAG